MGETGWDGSYPGVLAMLGVGDVYNLMGMGQDHVEDPCLWRVKRETRSLLGTLVVLLNVMGASLVEQNSVVLLLLGVLLWGRTGGTMVVK